MKFDDVFWPFPVLNTSRLTLRSLSQRDIHDVFEYCSKREVSEFVAWHSHQNLADSRGFIDWVLMNYQNRLAMTWAVEVTALHKVIGTCSYVTIDPLFKVCELGYALSSDFWGQGYASEAAMSLVHFGFSHVGFQRMEAKCMTGNHASARVLEKLGMRLEGVLRKGIFCKNRAHDLRLYAMTDDDYRRMIG